MTRNLIFRLICCVQEVVMRHKTPINSLIVYMEGDKSSLSFQSIYGQMSAIQRVHLLLFAIIEDLNRNVAPHTIRKDIVFCKSVNREMHRIPKPFEYDLGT